MDQVELIANIKLHDDNVRNMFVLFYPHFLGSKNIALPFSPLTDSLILELVEIALGGPSRSNDANLDKGSE